MVRGTEECRTRRKERIREGEREGGERERLRLEDKKGQKGGRVEWRMGGRERGMEGGTAATRT